MVASVGQSYRIHFPDTDSVALGQSALVDNEEDMLKSRVRASPSLMKRWRRARDSLISRNKNTDSMWGLWKRETVGAVECVFVAPKLYAYRFPDGSVMRKTKGLKKHTHHRMYFENFKKLLIDPLQKMQAYNVGFMKVGALVLTSRVGRRVRGVYLKRVFTSSDFNETMSYEYYDLLQQAKPRAPPKRKLMEDDVVEEAPKKRKVTTKEMAKKGPTREELRDAKRFTTGVSRVCEILGQPTMEQLDYATTRLNRSALIVFPHINHLQMIFQAPSPNNQDERDSD